MGAHLRRKLSENPDFEIDLPFPERSGILDGLGRETQADAWRRLGDGGHQGSGEPFNEPFVGANGEGPLKRGDVQ